MHVALQQASGANMPDAILYETLLVILNILVTVSAHIYIHTRVKSISREDFQ